MCDQHNCCHAADVLTVLVEVKGGAVQVVYCDQPQRVKVVVRDRDNIAAGDDDPLDDAPELKALCRAEYEVEF